MPVFRTDVSTPSLPAEGERGGGVEAGGAHHSLNRPQNVMSVCVVLIHPLQATSFRRHAPPQTPFLAMFVVVVFCL